MEDKLPKLNVGNVVVVLTLDGVSFVSLEEDGVVVVVAKGLKDNEAFLSSAKLVSLSLLSKVVGNLKKETVSFSLLAASALTLAASVGTLNRELAALLSLFSSSFLLELANTDRKLEVDPNLIGSFEASVLVS